MKKIEFSGLAIVENSYLRRLDFLDGTDEEKVAAVLRSYISRGHIKRDGACCVYMADYSKWVCFYGVVHGQKQERFDDQYDSRFTKLVVVEKFEDFENPERNMKCR